MALYGPDTERGSWKDGIRLVNLTDIDFDYLVEGLKNETTRRGIPATFVVDEYVSGKFFSKTRVPMLLIKNNQPGCEYFSLGIYANQNILMFPLFGQSAENTKANKYEYYKNQGTGLKASFYKPDMLKLQQEQMWQEDIWECVEEVMIAK